MSVREPGMLEGLSSFSLSHGVEKEHLQIGDHVYVWHSLYIWSHHGVVVSVNPCQDIDCQHYGDCVSVVHYSRPNDDSAHCVRITSLGQFSCGRPVKLCKYGASYLETTLKRAGSCYEAVPDQRHRVVFRALSLVGWGQREYNAIGRNCEAVARWCVVGNGTGEESADPRRRFQWSPQSNPVRVLTAVAVASVVPLEMIVAGVVVGLLDYVAAKQSSRRTERDLAASEHNARIPHIVDSMLSDFFFLGVPAAVQQGCLASWDTAVVLCDAISECIRHAAAPDLMASAMAPQFALSDADAAAVRDRAAALPGPEPSHRSWSWRPLSDHPLVPHLISSQPSLSQSPASGATDIPSLLIPRGSLAADGVQCLGAVPTNAASPCEVVLAGDRNCIETLLSTLSASLLQ